MPGVPLFVRHPLLQAILLHSAVSGGSEHFACLLDGDKDQRSSYPSRLHAQKLLPSLSLGTCLLLRRFVKHVLTFFVLPFASSKFIRKYYDVDERSLEEGDDHMDPEASIMQHILDVGASAAASLRGKYWSVHANAV